MEEKNPRRVGETTGTATSVYVAGLTWSTTDTELAAHFCRVGKVQSATVLTRNRRGEVFSVGCGIVKFFNARDAEKAIAELHDTELDGRKITVREDRKGGEETSGHEEKAVFADERPVRLTVPTKVFVRSLSWDTTDSTLLQAFSLAGRVVSATVRLNHRGKSAGTGVVEFADGASVVTAIALLNGKELDGRQIGVKEYYE